MDAPRQLVRTLYERYQARDWVGAAAVLHPEAQLQMPATGERLEGRDAIIGLQERYLGPWGDLQVLRVVGADGTATGAAELEVVAAAEVFRCAAFWTTEAGRLRSGVEYWITVGGETPPPR